jgi:6-phosphogluconolactonase (cycloisomerase 2 family)
MMIRKNRVVAMGGTALLALVGLAACSDTPEATANAAPAASNPAPSPSPAAPGPAPTTLAPSGSDAGTAPPPAKEAPKAVYTLSNDASSNYVYVFDRAADGSLKARSAYATGGKGTGAGLGDQGALAYEPSKRRFLAVNAGDDSISMLSLEDDGELRLLDKAASGGIKPISVTVSGATVYALNAGDDAHASNVSGFRIAGDVLEPIQGSTRPLSEDHPGPAQIQFTPDGTRLVVTEKATNEIDVYTVQAGVASMPKPQASAGVTPFGFAFGPGGRLLVSEAAGGADGASTTSSYGIAPDGTLSTISGAVPSGQGAACWLAVSKNHAYVANARSNSVTTYTIGADGSLTLAQADGVGGATGAGPIDLAVSDDDKFLYVVNGRDHSFSVFAIGADGTLEKKPDFAGLPPNAVGVVAR